MPTGLNGRRLLSDPGGYGRCHKNKRRTQARIHQRIRDLSPILPRLLESTDKELKDAQAILAAAMAVEQGQEFEHQGVTYRRREMSRSRKAGSRLRAGMGNRWRVRTSGRPHPAGRELFLELGPDQHAQ
ncbi:hypothetical protein AYX22_21975 (plasmid) [Arthrobacter sp. D5-1]|nr:hypothetical protein AYX22_21975 [Arthrobacter sp. D5-1]